MKIKLLAVLLVMTTLVACATSPTGRRQLMLVSEDQAISASREAYLSQMKELDAKGQLNTNPADVERVAARLNRRCALVRTRARRYRCQAACDETKASVRNALEGLPAGRIGVKAIAAPE